MGAVLLAERRTTGFTKRVAIKVILPRLLGDERALGLFVDEARLAARFVHPNLVAVNDFGEEAGVFYMVMELVEGPSLLELIRRFDAPMPPLLAAQLVADAGRGLSWAHQLVDDDGKPLGVVHRDISPDNIVISDVGTVKVLDFGIAKSRMRQQVTVVTGVMGKPAYMSPERVYGDSVDERADCWSLGVILHELLSGRRLFRGQGVEQLEAVARGPIAPLPSTTPPALAALVDSALQRPLSMRARTADFVDGLDRFLREHNSLRTPAELRAAVEAIAPGILQRRGTAAPAVLAPRGRPHGEATLDVAAGPGRTAPPPRLLVPAGSSTHTISKSEHGQSVQRSTLSMALVAGMAIVLVAGVGGAVVWSRPAAAPAAEVAAVATPAELPSAPAPVTMPAPAPTPDAVAAPVTTSAPAPAPDPTPARAAGPDRAKKAPVAAASTPVAFGGIYVPDRTPWVEVLIDGTKVGVSPLGSARKPWPVRAGRHTVTLFEPASATTIATTTIVVDAGSTMAVRP
jgi:serine/threonine protein kinase